MTQSTSEANRLMEEQSLGGDYDPTYADGVRDPDEEEEEEEIEEEDNDNNLIYCTCGHLDVDHVEYEEECMACDCSCEKFEKAL